MTKSELKKHLTYLEIATSMSKFSKCQFTKVACLIVDENGGIISTGVNGTISGTDNCNSLSFEQRDDHVDFSNKFEIHAEMNAILRLARSSTKPNNITIYTTISPCSNCLKHLLGLQSKSTKINKIIFGNIYHRYTESDIQKMKSYCSEANVELVHLKQLDV